jgi:hypothetical protein
MKQLRPASWRNGPPRLKRVGRGGNRCSQFEGRPFRCGPDDSAIKWIPYHGFSYGLVARATDEVAVDEHLCVHSQVVPRPGGTLKAR